MSKNVRDEILELVKNKYSFQIITIPGNGCFHFINDLINEEKLSESKIITKADELLGDFNFIDINTSKSVKIIDQYLMNSLPNQKFGIIIEDPSLLDTDKYAKSYFSQHTYTKIYFPTKTKDETCEIASAYNSALTEVELEKIYLKSGGIVRLIKYLSLHSVLLDKKDEEIIKVPELVALIEPIVSVLPCESYDLLEKLTVTESGKYKSSILEVYLASRPKKEKIDIALNVDLSFTENGILSPHLLTKTESDLLRSFVEKTTLTRDDIAEIKWGGESFESFSDEAINKTISRLNSKLSQFEIQTVPKVGYKISKKS